MFVTTLLSLPAVGTNSESKVTSNYVFSFRCTASVSVSWCNNPDSYPRKRRTGVKH
jgi:putative lipase involved disintegration of autophagic bodies